MCRSLRQPLHRQCIIHAHSCSWQEACGLVNHWPVLCPHSAVDRMHSQLDITATVKKTGQVLHCPPHCWHWHGTRAYYSTFLTLLSLRRDNNYCVVLLWGGVGGGTWTCRILLALCYYNICFPSPPLAMNVGYTGVAGMVEISGQWCKMMMPSLHKLAILFAVFTSSSRD